VKIDGQFSGPDADVYFLFKRSPGYPFNKEMLDVHTDEIAFSKYGTLLKDSEDSEVKLLIIQPNQVFFLKNPYLVGRKDAVAEVLNRMSPQTSAVTKIWLPDSFNSDH